MNLAYEKLRDETEQLRAEVQVLREHNRLLAEKLNERLNQQTPSEDKHDSSNN